MKILTGQIVPQSKYLSGCTATINFDTQRVDGNATWGRMATTGRGRFTSPPGFILALRDFIAQYRRKASEDWSEKDRFRIDTTKFDSNHLEVEWKCEKGAEIREISYLIVGEVE